MAGNKAETETQSQKCLENEGHHWKAIPPPSTILKDLVVSLIKTEMDAANKGRHWTGQLGTDVIAKDS